MVTDHKGIRYSTLKEMAVSYGVKYSTFHMRRKAGFTLEESLEGKVQGPDGKRYNSDKALSEAYGVRPDRFAKRKQRGWSTNECISGKSRKK